MPASATDSALHLFFGNSRDALLVCSRRATNQYVIDYINPATITILGSAVVPACPFPLEDLFPETALSETLEAVYQTPNSGPVTLKTPLPPEKQIDAEVNLLAGQLVIRLTERLAPLTQAIGTHSADSSQRDLRAQMNLVEEILNSTTNPIYLAEALRDTTGTITDFRIVRCNDAGRKNMVRTVGFDGTGSTVLTLYPFSRERGLFAAFVGVVETGEAFETEQYYAYGTIRDWQHVAARKVGNGVVVTYTDMTESQRIRQQIEQSAAELRAVIDCAQVAIFLITPVWSETTDEPDRKIIDFRFRIANRKFASYVGKEPESLTGLLASQWFPGYRKTGLFDRYVTLFTTGQPQHFDYHYDTQGHDVWLNVTANKLENDVLVTFSDYTQLKELQHRLEASTTELQTVLNTSQTGIFLFAPVRNEVGEVVDFRFRLANRQLAAYVGQTPEVVTGGLGSTWFPDYQTNGLFDAYYKTYATGETQRFDFHYFGSGIDVWLDIMSTKLGDEVLVTFGDYTPLKRLQQRLEASVIELQHSNANLEQFAYVASHDLQEPLRKIQSFGDLLQTQYAPALGADGADLIGRMQSAAARMQVLIKDVLAYSRIATKRDALRPVDLNELVKEVLNDLETVITDKRAVVRVGPLPTVVGDAPQLRQLFQNLMSNALKFTRSGVVPELQLDARLVKGCETGLPVAAADYNRLFHEFVFSDNGIGFEPRHAERIFQVFQRLHGRSEYVGTGIGLAIVQKVVQNHQGYIVAEGQPGRGATFRMLLPAEEV